jgi:hypothetical protein
MSAVFLASRGRKAGNELGRPCFRDLMFVIIGSRFHPRAGGKFTTAASGLGELRNVVEVAGLPRLEEGDRGAGRTVAWPR